MNYEQLIKDLMNNLPREINECIGYGRGTLILYKDNSLMNHHFQVRLSLYENEEYNEVLKFLIKLCNDFHYGKIFNM